MYNISFSSATNSNVATNNNNKKNKIMGAAQVATGTAITYKGIEHGLPRTLGIRIEYHVTPKENAKKIKEMGNILDPSCGGINGMSSKMNGIAKKKFTNNSQGFVHITGVNSKTLPRMGFEPPKGLLQTINRKEQCLSYKNTGKKTKRFCIPGIDSYFDKNFIADADDFALKTTNKLKCYTNRFNAMFAGLKEHGLKGMKENKNRVMLGITMLATTAILSYKLIENGIKKIKSNN